MAKKQISEEQIKLLADHIMPGFIPRDKDALSFKFNFTTEGINYKGEYMKKGSAWILHTVEQASDLPNAPSI